MDIDPKTLITASIGFVGTAAIGWIGIIRRIDTKVSRHELHDNLERRDTRVQEDLKRVLAALDKQNEKSAEHRKLTTDHLQELSRDIAVLKDRAGRSRGNAR
jgi:hypothetical protein